MSDPIADLIIRIKNASLSNLKEVIMPFSNFKIAILNIFQKYGYIKSVDTKLVKEKKVIVVTLSDNKIMHIRRLSKPGQRLYVKSKEIPRPLRGMGLVVISTPSGVISGADARKSNIGGELICEIW